VGFLAVSSSWSSFWSWAVRLELVCLRVVIPLASFLAISGSLLGPQMMRAMMMMRMISPVPIPKKSIAPSLALYFVACFIIGTQTGFFNAAAEMFDKSG
jgi:hypothetical protein